MASILAGIVLVIAAVFLWAGVLTLGHAVAILMGVTGLLLIIWYAAPARYYGRRGQ
jgi:hypothetical protein